MGICKCKLRLWWVMNRAYIYVYSVIFVTYHITFNTSSWIFICWHISIM
jgi:hypothetical protein